MNNKEHVIETSLSRDEVVNVLNSKISQNVKLQISNEYWFRGEIKDYKFSVVFEPNQGYHLVGRIDSAGNGKTKICISFYGGDVYALVFSIITVVGLSISYLRFKSILCFIGAILVGIFVFAAFSSKKEKCLSVIRGMVDGVIVR